MGIGLQTTVLLKTGGTSPSHYRSPCQRTPEGWKELDARGKMVCRGQIVDMVSGSIYSNHNLFIPNGADWTFDKKKTSCPIWLEFLSQLFADKADEVAMLQEWFGYVLSGDTWAQKGLIIVGPPRAGKGIIGHVLSNLLGKSMVSSPALHAIGTRFGLEDLIEKRMCLISDARLSNRQDIFAVVETLLRIIGGDSLSVDRKNKLALNLDLDARIMMLSNEMPQLSDNGPAINNRFLIIKLRESFLGREDVHLLDKLIPELPAIANWAVEGYRRLVKAYKFTEPQSSRDARDEWCEETNPLEQFVKDCLKMDDGTEVKPSLVTNGDLYKAYLDWCEVEGIKFPAPKNDLKRKLNHLLGHKIKLDKSNKSVKATLGFSLNPDRPKPGF